MRYFRGSHFASRAIICLPILLLAFYARLDTIGDQPVWWDEAYSVWAGNMGLLEVTQNTARDLHPPLYYWLLHGWLRIAGDSEFAIRILSAFPSIITVTLVYCIARSLSKRHLAAVLALLIIALSPFHIHWSQDARMYSLAAMFSALFIYAYARRQPRLLALAGSGASLTHYFGLITIGAVVLYDLLFSRAKGRERRSFYAAIAVVAAVNALWGAYAIGLIRRDPSLVTFDPKALILLMANVFADFSVAQQGVLTPATLLITIIYFSGLALVWRERRRLAAFILIGSLLPLVILSLLSLPFVPLHVGYLRDRHLLIFAPFVFCGLGIGLASMMQSPRLRFIGIIAIVGILANQAAGITQRRDDRYFRDDFRGMAAAVNALTTADDQVFVISGQHTPLFGYHLDRVGYDAPRRADASRANVVGVPGHVADVPAMMEWLVAGYPRFWVVEMEAHIDEQHLSPEEPIAKIEWLDETHELLYQIQYGWYNSFSYYSRVPGEIFDRNHVTDVILPAITEARPGDFVRIGVPAGSEVQLTRSGVVLESLTAENWTMLQFYIHAHYPNGDFALAVDGIERFRFKVTHSLAEP